MKWYYADGGRQVGPVEDTQLDDLVRAGAIRDDTLVWREGMASWQTHAAVRGPIRAGAPAPPPPVAAPAAAAAVAVEARFCSECGRPFPVHELVAIGNATVCAQCKPVFMQRMREGGQPAIGARRYAGFWIRAVAIIIDGVLLGVLGFIVAMPLRMFVGVAAVSPDPTAALPALFGLLGLSMLINVGVGICYYVYFVSTKGATPGKMALGLKIIRADGGKISVGLALGRYFSYLLSSLIMGIGYIIAGFDSEKRALHDHICGTRVIYVK